MPKIAFSTLACPDWTWPQVLDAAARCQYDGVEVRQIAGETDLLKIAEFYSSQLGERRNDLQRLGVTICGLASSVRFDYPKKEQRDEQLRVGMAYVELAAELEAGFVRVFGDVLPPPVHSGERSAALSQIAEGLNRLAEFAARYKIDILLETHGDFAETPVVVDLMRRIEMSGVGVLWDTHHPWRFFGEPLDQTLSALKPWIRHTHWKDSVTRPQRASQRASHTAEAQAHALMSGHRHADYVLFGGGEFPIEECARLLKKAGYDGWLSLEWEKMWHPTIESPEIALPLFALKMRALWSRIDV